MTSIASEIWTNTGPTYKTSKRTLCNGGPDKSGILTRLDFSFCYLSNVPDFGRGLLVSARCNFVHCVERDTRTASTASMHYRDRSTPRLQQTVSWS